MPLNLNIGAPLLASGSDGAGTAGSTLTNESEGCGKTGAHSSTRGLLKRALVVRAGSLGPPQKKLKAAMLRGPAQIGGENGHFINEIELHPVRSDCSTRRSRGSRKE